jgi:hypothetical protein
VSACPTCASSIMSVMAVTCDVCQTELRARTLDSGLPIRRSPRRPAAPQPVASDGCGADCGC